MENLKELAEKYEAPSTKCITELEFVPIDIKVQEVERGKGSEAFKMLITEIDGEEYKIPKSVIATLKELLKSKPDLKAIKVTKSGKGMSTKYTTIPL